VTLTVCATPPAGVTVIVPSYVPGARDAGVTETFKVALFVPDAGVTASQLPPLVVAATAVKLCEPVICKLCAAGTGPFCVYANASVVGLTLNGALVPLTVKLTAICETTPPEVVSVTVP
jgi:hypothetical protein